MPHRSPGAEDATRSLTRQSLAYGTLGLACVLAALRFASEPFWGEDVVLLGVPFAAVVLAVAVVQGGRGVRAHGASRPVLAAVLAVATCAFASAWLGTVGLLVYFEIILL